MISVVSKINSAGDYVDVDCKIDIPENPESNEEKRYEVLIHEMVATVMGIIETAHRDSPEDVGVTVENLIDGVVKQVREVYGGSDGVVS